MWGSGVAQSVDSVEVSGRVQWKDTRITGYPNELKVISTTKKIYLTQDGLENLKKEHEELAKQNEQDQKDLEFAKGKANDPNLSEEERRQ